MRELLSLIIENRLSLPNWTWPAVIGNADGAARPGFCDRLRA
jgi:hypothetical protein